MAPEQMRGESLDGRADQFSWGVVAYELLSGELPWDRDGDQLKILSQLLTKHPQPLDAIVHDLPSGISGLVMRAIEKAAGARFPSMDDVCACLDSYAPRSTGPSPTVISPSALTLSSVNPSVHPSTRTSLATASAPAELDVPPQKNARRKWFVGAAGILVASGITLLVARGLQRAGPSSTTGSVPSPSATPPVPTAVTSLPLPSTNPGALAAYQEAMRSFRRGEQTATAKAFRRAIEADPQLAPALFRLGHSKVLTTPVESREQFRRAMQLKDTMTQRDQELLHALEPDVTRAPPDFAETRSRLEQLVTRYPADAEIHYLLAIVRDALGDLDSAFDEYRRAVDIDPEFALAIQGEANVYAVKGDFSSALTASRDCERAAPGVSACSIVRDKILVQEGLCAELEEDARHSIVIDPNAAIAYYTSAQALAALGRPPTAIREALAQARLRADPTKGSVRYAVLEANVSVLQGDFVEAERLTRAYEARPDVMTSSEEPVHGIAAWTRIEIANETGRPEDALAIASDFHDRSAAWASAALQAFVFPFEFRPRVDALLVRAGRLAPSVLEATRASVASQDGEWWVSAYARPSETPAEATDALGVRAKFKPLDKLQGFPSDEPVGKTDLLAGQIDEAVGHLRRASLACTAIFDPFDQTRASLLLGRAYEAKNDTPSACAAYATVVARWGHAKPRSVSAEAALARMRALRCAP